MLKKNKVVINPLLRDMSAFAVLPRCLFLILFKNFRPDDFQEIKPILFCLLSGAGLQVFLSLALHFKNSFRVSDKIIFKE